MQLIKKKSLAKKGKLSKSNGVVLQARDTINESPRVPARITRIEITNFRKMILKPDNNIILYYYLISSR